MKETFADTYFYLALLNPRDAAHSKALEAGRANVGFLVTTEFVLLEVADALAAPQLRERFNRLLDALHADPTVTVVPASNDLFQRGVALYRERSDKDWPLTDCISFAVMEERSIRDALTGDAHFRQAGLNTLL